MRRRGLWLWVWVMMAAAGIGGCSRNPLTGGRAFNLLTPAEEMALGEEAGPKLAEQSGGVYGDPVIAEYVRSVGAKVAAVAGAAVPGLPYRYTFTVLDSDEVNAFALPGGPIYITRGLLMRMRDESELAGVLSHEAVHVAGQHSAQQISAQLGVGFMLGLAKVLTTKEEAPPSAETPSRAETIARVVVGLAGLRYSRKQEKEADLYGVDFMVQAGYQPAGLMRVMQMFEALEQESGGGGLEFLRSHPSPKNRVASIRERMDEEHPGAATDPRLAVGREAYQEKVLARRDLIKQYSKPAAKKASGGG